MKQNPMDKKEKSFQSYLIRPTAKAEREKLTLSFRKEYPNLTYPGFLALARPLLKDGLTVKEEQLPELYLFLSDRKDKTCPDTCEGCADCDAKEKKVTPFQVMRVENQGICNCANFLLLLFTKESNRYEDCFKKTFALLKQLCCHYQKKEELFFPLFHEKKDQEFLLKEKEEDQAIQAALLKELGLTETYFSRKERLSSLLKRILALADEENEKVYAVLESRVQEKEIVALSKAMPEYSYAFLTVAPKPEDYCH
jgi:hypothetical protein